MSTSSSPVALDLTVGEGVGAPELIAPGQLLLTVPQVARLLGMSSKAIYHRAERGQLPGVVRVGRSLRFRRAELVGSLSEGRGLSPKASR